MQKTCKTGKFGVKERQKKSFNFPRKCQADIANYKFGTLFLVFSNPSISKKTSDTYPVSSVGGV